MRIENWKLKITKVAFIFLIFFLFALPFSLSANSDNLGIWEKTTQGESGGCNTALTGCSLIDGITVLLNVIQLIFELAIPIAVGMLIYGAILMMVPGDSQSRLTKSKEIIKMAVIGLIIILTGTLIVQTVMYFLVDETKYPQYVPSTEQPQPNPTPGT